MMNTWADDEEEDSAEKKRKKECEYSENKLLLIVMMMLDSIFSDTDLKWKSGEKTTDATKRARVVGQMLSRKLKDGSSVGDSTKQESRSLRCTKSLISHNRSFGQKVLLSFDWSGFNGYSIYLKIHKGITVVLPGHQLAIPTSKDCIDGFEGTLVALYEFKKIVLALLKRKFLLKMVAQRPK
ncbi:hypothetical protein BD560DRAFT_473219 [Blakeslea trispora]|nr:hypothetical protein BD560DRAFT_473219 [Blakeslea trispora]